MKRRSIAIAGAAVAAALLLASSATFAMKKGTVKFFNETKGFGFLKAEVDYFTAGTALSPEEALRAVHKGLNAVNVKLARAASGQGSGGGTGTEVDGLGLYAIVDEPGGMGPDHPTALFMVPQGDFVDFVFEVSSRAGPRQTSAAEGVGFDTKELPMLGAQPIELLFEWPAGLRSAGNDNGMPDNGVPDNGLVAGGNLVVQVRLPLAALDERAKVTVRGWDPRLMGATFPGPTGDFLASGDHVTLADRLSLNREVFNDWVAGTALGVPDVAEAIAAGSKVTKADAGRIAAALTTPGGVDRPSTSPSGLGLFSVSTRPELPGRSPTSGAAITLGGRKVMRFKAGAELASSVKK